MQLTVFNGSPRGKSSNTAIVLDHFLRGFIDSGDNTYEIIYLNQVKKQEEFVRTFSGSSHVLLSFPLYTDAMPAMVKTFIESLTPLSGRGDNPRIGFIVHSGFPESIHSRYVARYLEKLAKRLGCSLFGIAIKGGSEGIQVMPPLMTRKLFKRLYKLGLDFGITGQFNRQIVTELSKPERYPLYSRLLIRVMALFGLTDSYWNGLLKKNSAHSNRFARPYDAPKINP